jgi:hypothetical protein
MPLVTAASIEQRFSSAGQLEFAAFCNSLIALESPRTTSFPNLSSKSGQDGGIDGQWNLTGAAAAGGPFTRTGWNVYQFKSVDIAVGSAKAFRQLCAQADGAIARLIARLESPSQPALYVFFTNLQLGIDRPTRTKAKARQNTKFSRLRSALLRGAPTGSNIEIVDAGKLEGFIHRNRILRVTWFADRNGSTWEEAYRREVNQWKIDAPLKGREADLKQLDAWLADDAVRVIALTGVNSIGKTRLALESSRPLAPITFFADDIAALLRDGIATLGHNNRPVVIAVDDPSSSASERLAKQALGHDGPVKVLMTIASQKQIPATVFGDESRVKTRHIGPLPHDSAQELLDAMKPDFDHRARDWVLQQAGGNPGIIIEAALLGSKLRESVDGLRARLTINLQNRLEAKLGSDAVLVASVLSPLAYVKIETPELQLLLDSIAPNVSDSIVRARLTELETFGCVRRRGKTVAVFPPIFAAGLLQSLLHAQPVLPTTLFLTLDHEGRTRLLERLVTAELSDNAPFWDELLHIITEQSPSSDLKEQLETLESLARAVPRVVASFLERELDDILGRVELFADARNLVRLADVIHELIEETETGSLAFDLLTRVSKYNATHADHRAIANEFRECFVWWYPRPFTYRQRQACLEDLLGSEQASIRLLAASALVAATDIPHSLSGRGVVARRLGMAPNRTLMREVHGFLEWALNRRIELARSRDGVVERAAADKLENVIGPLADSLPGETAIRLIGDLMKQFFDGAVSLNAQNLLGQLKWVRNLYAKFSAEGPEQYKESWIGLVGQIDGWIDRLTSGPFKVRLKLALGPTYDHEEVEFEGRKLYTPDVRVIRLAREATADPQLMSGAWELLVDESTPNAAEFVRELGRSDSSRNFYSEFLSRADNWSWARLLGTYLAGAQEEDNAWVEQRLAEQPVSRGQSNLAGLLAYQQTGFNEANRQRLRKLIKAKAISPHDLGTAFSYGRWLESLPIDEVRIVLEYIQSDSTSIALLVQVISLYLHRLKPLAAELIPVARATLTQAQEFNDHGNFGYHCDQIAIGIAKTNLEAGFEIMDSLLKAFSTSGRSSWYGGWNPLDWPGSRDFWVFLRDRDAKRLYLSLAKLDRKWRWPDMRHHRSVFLIDLEQHRDLLLDIARSDAKAAEIFADCLVSSQPGFVEFVFKLLELYPDAQSIHSALVSAVLEKSGFGSALQHLVESEQFIESALKSAELSELGRRWLKSLKQAVIKRRQEEQQMFGDDPPIWD